LRSGAVLVDRGQPEHGALDPGHDFGDIDFALGQASEKALDDAREDELEISRVSRINLNDNGFNNRHDGIDAALDQSVATRPRSCAKVRPEH
jgi:hypothetical protein